MHKLKHAPDSAKNRVDGKLFWAIGQADPALSFDNQPNELETAVELLTIPEAAQFLTISNSGMRRLQEGRHVPFFKVRGSIRFAKSDLVSYLAKQRVGSIGK